MEKINKEFEFNKIQTKVFDMIKEVDPNFEEELKVFQNIENNKDKGSVMIAFNILSNLIENYKIKKIKCNFKLAALKIKPFILQIPDHSEFREHWSRVYYDLLHFERCFERYIKYTVLEGKLKKDFFNLSMYNYKECVYNDLENISNIYITLKTIETLQINLDKDIDSFSAYIDEFSPDYRYKPYKTNNNQTKIKELKFYLSGLNKLDKGSKKKAKFLHC